MKNRLTYFTLCRDSFAKTLYQTLFIWLVSRLNKVTRDSRQTSQPSSSSSPVAPAPTEFKTCSIAILDVFGFENMPTNSLEQLCINYSNERLQHYFNCYIFKREQEVYISEMLTWTRVRLILRRSLF